MTDDSPTPDELADSMLRATPEDPTVDARPADRRLVQALQRGCGGPPDGPGRVRAIREWRRTVRELAAGACVPVPDGVYSGPDYNAIEWSLKIGWELDVQFDDAIRGDATNTLTGVSMDFELPATASDDDLLSGILSMFSFAGPDHPASWPRANAVDAAQPAQGDLDTKRHDLTAGSLLASFGAGLFAGVLVGLWLA